MAWEFWGEVYIHPPVRPSVPSVCPSVPSVHRSVRPHPSAPICPSVRLSLRYEPFSPILTPELSVRSYFPIFRTPHYFPFYRWYSPGVQCSLLFLLWPFGTSSLLESLQASAVEATASASEYASCGAHQLALNHRGTLHPTPNRVTPRDNMATAPSYKGPRGPLDKGPRGST